MSASEIRLTQERQLVARHRSRADSRAQEALTEINDLRLRLYLAFTRPTITVHSDQPAAVVLEQMLTGRCTIHSTFEVRWIDETAESLYARLGEVERHITKILHLERG